MFINKQRALLIIFCLLVVGVLILFIILGFTANSPTQITPDPFPTPTPIESGVKNKIPIGTVEVNNFLEDPIQTNPSGDALLLDNDSYRIVYIAVTKEFLIRILTTPFEQKRQEAERAFLSTLGITQEQACQLNVSVFPPINEDQLENSYPLSFCNTTQ